jgi:hypothetical protein
MECLCVAVALTPVCITAQTAFGWKRLCCFWRCVWTPVSKCQLRVVPCRLASSTRRGVRSFLCIYLPPQLSTTYAPKQKVVASSSIKRRYHSPVPHRMWKFDLWSFQVAQANLGC